MGVPLKVNLKLLHYRLVEKIGEGGMGEVWRAMDTTLDREVALKFLPTAFASDVERVARFEREAKLLASLNHAAIAAIYSLHESDGGRFLAMELVPGEDLARRLARGPMPVREALQLARQIAEALEAAHEHGVIHRDLKPANVKVCPDGSVKVLDFGLAKMLAPASVRAGNDFSASPTITSLGTVAGLVLGTAAYMSPEQARGKPVDRRTDIWSFGCLLYEMLSGRTLFRGESASDTIAAVLRAEVVWSSLAVATPRPIRALLSRCLDRDPRTRLRDIGEARIALGETLSGSTEAGAASEEAPSFRAGPWIGAAVGLALGIVGMAVVGNSSSGRRPEALITYVTVPLAPSKGLDLGANLERDSFDLSPDGRTLAFVGRSAESSERQLFVRRLDRSAATPLDGTLNALHPIFSPDGRWIAFLAGPALRRIPVGGGPVETITEGVAGLYSFCWSDALGIVFAGVSKSAGGMVEAGLWKIRPGAGAPEKLQSFPIDARYRFPLMPFVVPGGKAVMYSIGGVQEPHKIEMLILADDQIRTIAEGINAKCLKSGHLLFTKEGRLLHAPFDHHRLELTGTPQPVLDGLLMDMTDARAARYSVSANGVLAYVPASSFGTASENLVLVDRAGNAAPAGGPAGSYTDLSLSPDGTMLAYNTPQLGNDVWIRDLRRQTLTRLTFDPGEDETPVWSPDGRWVAYSATRTGEKKMRAIYRRRPDGSGNEEKIWEGDEHTHVNGWTQDGRTLIVDASTPGRADIWAIDVDGKTAPRTLLGSARRGMHARLSPDGRWLAFVSDATGRMEVYIQAYPSLDRKIAISNDGGTSPVWSREGRELYYRGGSRMMSVEVGPGADPTVSKPLALFDRGDVGSGDDFSYDIAPDGRFLMTERGQTPFPRELSIIMNWEHTLGPGASQ